MDKTDPRKKRQIFLTTYRHARRGGDRQVHLQPVKVAFPTRRLALMYATSTTTNTACVHVRCTRSKKPAKRACVLEEKNCDFSRKKAPARQRGSAGSWRRPPRDSAPRSIADRSTHLDQLLAAAEFQSDDGLRPADRCDRLRLKWVSELSMSLIG